MTRIDFYVLATADLRRRFDVVCKLAEKAVRADERVIIHATDHAVLNSLDEHMWAYRAESFLAHQVVSESDAEQAPNLPVHLSADVPAADRSLLINLAPEVPHFFSRFARTLEVVDQSTSVREAGRERYRFYKHRGYPLKHHAI